MGYLVIIIMLIITDIMFYQLIIALLFKYTILQKVFLAKPPMNVVHTVCHSFVSSF